MVAAEDNDTDIAGGAPVAVLRRDRMVRPVAEPCLPVSRSARSIGNSLPDRRFCHYLCQPGCDAVNDPYHAAGDDNSHNGADMSRPSSGVCSSEEGGLKAFPHGTDTYSSGFPCGIVPEYGIA